MGCNSTKSTATSNRNSPSIYYFVMSKKKLEELKQTFRAIDIDNDGSLSVEELRHVFVRHGKYTEKDVQDFIKEADKDGNNKIEFDEFVALITARMENAIANLHVIFDSFDKDNDGVLTKKEVKALLKELGKDTSSANVERVFNAIDENNDGEITFEEFVSFFIEL